jgi:hypothetical protein
MQINTIKQINNNLSLVKYILCSKKRGCLF